MSELEIALLVVLILILVILVLKWYKSSKDSCMKSCAEASSTYNKMATPGGVVSKTETDGYTDMDESFSGSRSNSSSVENSHDVNALMRQDLNGDITRSHRKYLEGSLQRTSGASLRSVPDHDTLPNKWMGMRPQMHNSHQDASARTVSSEDPEQHHRTGGMRWSHSDM